MAEFQVFSASSWETRLFHLDNKDIGVKKWLCRFFRRIWGCCFYNKEYFPSFVMMFVLPLEFSTRHLAAHLACIGSSGETSWWYQWSRMHHATSNHEAKTFPMKDRTARQVEIFFETRQTCPMACMASINRAWSSRPYVEATYFRWDVFFYFHSSCIYYQTC